MRGTGVDECFQLLADLVRRAEHSAGVGQPGIAVGRGEPPLDLAPASGDLLVMGGRTQQDWLHAVPKSPTAMRDRVSVQWRWTSTRGRPDTAPSFYDARRFSKR